MYRCEICHKTTKCGEKQNNKVIETRKKIYRYIDKNGKERKSEGTEIVKEIKVCEECFNKEN